MFRKMLSKYTIFSTVLSKIVAQRGPLSEIDFPCCNKKEQEKLLGAGSLSTDTFVFFSLTEKQNKNKEKKKTWKTFILTR